MHQHLSQLRISLLKYVSVFVSVSSQTVIVFMCKHVQVLTQYERRTQIVKQS